MTKSHRVGEQRRRADALAARLGMVLLVDRIETPAEVWSLRPDDDDWLLVAGGERARLRDGRGVHYLRMLLAVPGHEIAALDLVAGGTGLAAPSGEPVLDDAALHAYQRRLAALDSELDAADRGGDGDRADRAEHEREALLAELRRATGIGGRPRVAAAESERARVNVTRTLRATIARLGPVAPVAAAHLDASVRTGRLCCYRPAPGPPSRWAL